MILRKGRLLLADEVWLTVARMHQNHPDAEGFPAREILFEARKANLTGQMRQGFNAHINSHTVANRRPSPAVYRMLFELPNGDRRLYRPGDPTHPDRNGKIAPNREDLPAEYQHYLDWYENVYCAGGRAPTAAPSGRSFIDRLSGLGKSIWSDTSADDYVLDLRKGWDN